MIFPIGLGIFPPAGDIPDGSEDKGVKGTFLISGGNIPGGPGISPGFPRLGLTLVISHYHGLAPHVAALNREINPAPSPSGHPLLSGPPT